MDCGKKTYPQKKLAETALNWIRKKSHRKHLPKRIYFCENCAGYHLTSKANEDIRKSRRWNNKLR